MGSYVCGGVWDCFDGPQLNSSDHGDDAMNAQSVAMPSARATRASHRARAGLGHTAGIAIAGEYPNFFASWQRECAENDRLRKLLDRSLALLEMETHRRECAGEDVAHIRAFIGEARA
jgi:hypothetical protein